MTAGTQDRRQDDHHTRQPDRRRDERRANDDGPPSSGERRRALLTRFRQPLIGLGLVGLALPMVQATRPGPNLASLQGDEESDPNKVAATNADTEEALAERIAESREEQERASHVEAAVTRYSIERDLAEDIYDIAREENVDPKLAYGLVKTESTFDERAKSHVGARGLTQVMPRTAAWLVPGTRTEDLYNRHINLRLGFRYLDQMIDKYKGDVRLALLAYNRGPGTVDKVLKRGGNPDNGYADKVLRG